MLRRGDNPERLAQRSGYCNRTWERAGRVDLDVFAGEPPCRGVYAPHGHWKTITFVAGLRLRAMTAPFVLEGAMNGPMFFAYVKQCLVPTLKRGDIVAMDNLPVHRVAGVAEAIEAADATLLYLPPADPDESGWLGAKAVAGRFESAGLLKS